MAIGCNTRHMERGPSTHGPLMVLVTRDMQSVARPCHPTLLYLAITVHKSPCTNSQMRSGESAGKQAGQEWAEDKKGGQTSKHAFLSTY